MENFEDALGSKLPPLPGHKVHRCTDWVWIVAFIVALGVQVELFYSGITRGDISKLSRGYNYESQLCGINTTDLKNKNLFHCMTREGEVLIESPICVSQCPVGNGNGTHACIDASTNELREYPDYETVEVFNYCLPMSQKRRRKVLKEKTVSFPPSREDVAFCLSRAGSILKHSWLSLLISANAAVAIGYGYLLLMEKHAKLLVYLLETGMVVGSLALGCYIIYTAFHGGSDGISNTGDSNIDLVAGSGLLLFGLASFCFVRIVNRKIVTAIGCIETTCECLFQEPTLLLEPFISLTLKGLVVVTCGTGFLQLLSAGDLQIGEVRDGFRRTFSYTGEQKTLIVAQCVMTAWLLEFVHAMSQYTIAWTTQMWYFTPYVNGRKVDQKKCAVLRAYWNAVRFHVGTLALGAILNGIGRFPRIALGFLRKSVNNGNCISRITRNMCSCCLRFHQKWLIRFNKCAYMDVAITSSDYIVASERARLVFTEELKSLSGLHGAPLVFQMVLNGAVAVSGFFLVMAMSKNVSIFYDTESPYFIEDAKLVALLSSAINYLIGVSFTIVFGTVGDTVLYCYATEQRRHAHLNHEKYSNCHEEPPGYFSWLLGSGAPKAQKPSRVNYAPQKLQHLIDKERLEGQSGSDDEAWD